jgi:hypothetical protein
MPIAYSSSCSNRQTECFLLGEGFDVVSGHSTSREFGAADKKLKEIIYA